MDNIELAKSKLERAYRIYENFDCISEIDVKNIMHCILNVLELVPSENPDKYELYGHVRNLVSRDIKKYGVIFKAMNWKDSVILKKEDIGDMIKQTTNFI